MIQVTLKEEQVQGAFDQGTILERKPIGFPQDGGKQKPYSTLFYWAHAWSEKGGLIGEHPHKGFEIMSFVLEGSIEHYDSKHQAWKQLNEGDVQIIRAGSGITHAEKINPRSSIFQIWFDPDVSKTIGQPASYNDYAGVTFPVYEDAATQTKMFVGGTSSIQMESKVDAIQEITFKSSEKIIDLDQASIYSFFVLQGTMQVGNQPIHKGDYVVVQQEEKLHLVSIEIGSRIFSIKSPLHPGFVTYAERMNH
jgi:quercetin 2,3-dioxygenase